MVESFLKESHVLKISIVFPSTIYGSNAMIRLKNTYKIKLMCSIYHMIRIIYNLFHFHLFVLDNFNAQQKLL